MIVTRISTTKDYNAYSNIVDMILVTLGLLRVSWCYRQPPNKPDRGRVQKYIRSIVGVPTL